MKNVFKLVCLLLLSTIVSNAQDIDFTDFNTIKSKKFNGASLIESYLPKNYDKKGKTDYSTYIQKALNENDKLIFPNFPILVNDKGLKFKSNQNILFQKSSQLVLKSSSNEAYKVINISGVKNVNIYYLNIKGDKYSHKGKTGQWGHGVIINSSSNINIYNPNIENFWGDGIYIGSGSSVTNSVLIKGGYINDNRRNGISVISGRNITIDGVYISNTKGQNPQSGIDIEPNKSNEILENINLNNIITKNNGLHGIVISVGNLDGSYNNPISININNHKDIGSKVSLGISITRLKNEYKKPILGKITIDNINYDPLATGVKNYKGKKHNVILDIDNINLSNKKIIKNSSKVKSFKENYNNSLETVIN